MPVRLAHFSDVHLTRRRLGWKGPDLVRKTLSGWVSTTFLGRGRRFRYADRVVDAMLRELRERPLDGLVFSGDASALGFDAEVTAAARRLGAWDPALPPAVAVPGNHDLYTAGPLRRRTFEAAFSAWQVGERAEADHTYPFARKVGHVWLICLNSARPNRLPWDATGHVGPAQLDRLRALCARLDDGPRVVVSHYPLLTHARRPAPRWHALTDWRQARDAAAECGVSLWLHGHRHAWYVLPAGDGLPFHSVCVGSSSQLDLWGYHEYTIDDATLHGLRRVYDPAARRFVDGETFELELTTPS